MNAIEWYAYVILPLSIGAIGYAIGYFYSRGGKNDHPHPGE
jgi:hypothetical protein